MQADTLTVVVVALAWQIMLIYRNNKSIWKDDNEITGNRIAVGLRVYYITQMWTFVIICITVNVKW